MSKKIIAMIPARMGSQRVKMKNLRLIDGKPLIWYVINACKQAEIFSSIYVNSESDVIGNYAVSQGVQFYQRPLEFASNSASNDGFGLDFMNAISSDIVIQVNPTSPFISPEEIRAFVNNMLKNEYETLHSVKNEQIEGLFSETPLNFNPLKPMPPSQELIPIQLFSSGIMGFDVKRFKENMKEIGCAVYGGQGKIGYYTLKGYSTIDIDNEEDFQLAEAVANALKNKAQKIEYYSQDAHDVDNILEKDGVGTLDLKNCNNLHVSLDDLRLSNKDHSWAKRVISTSDYSATFICQNPGEGNRNHYHPDRDEWWVVFDGEIDWTLGDGTIVHAKKHDIVFAPKGIPHSIKVVGDKQAIRLAISIDGMEHVFV